MKYLKVLLIAVITIFTFGQAKAQVSVRIGARPHRHYVRHRRVVVVRHPVRHHYYMHHYRHH